MNGFRGGRTNTGAHLHTAGFSSEIRQADSGARGEVCSGTVPTPAKSTVWVKPDCKESDILSLLQKAGGVDCL